MSGNVLKIPVLCCKFLRQEISHGLATLSFYFMVYLRSSRRIGGPVTRWTTGFRFSAGPGVFPPCHRVQTGSGAHPASYPVGTYVLSVEVKRPGHEADHSTPCMPRLRMGVAIPPFPNMCS